MSPEERAQLRDEHFPVPMGEKCDREFERWPCAVIRLLDALEAAEAREEECWCPYDDTCPTHGVESSAAAKATGFRAHGPPWSAAESAVVQP